MRNQQHLQCDFVFKSNVEKAFGTGLAALRRSCILKVIGILGRTQLKCLTV